MEQEQKKYKLLKRVQDEKFNIDLIGQYVLLIQLGIRDLQVAVIDSDDNRCLLLEDFVVGQVSSASELNEAYKAIFDEHQVLQAGFWKSVKVAVKNQKFSHVPSALFIPEACADYLKINCKVDSSDTFHYYKSLKSEVVTVFALNKSLKTWLEDLYPNSRVEFTHQSSTLIEGVLQYARSHKNISMYLYIDRFKMHIITLKGNGLEYYNQFTIKQFADYIKYIMLVFKGLQLDQQKSNVVMWGYIGKQSPHYNEFYKFIQTISFGDRSDYLKFGFVFDEIQDHHFFDLYSTFLCS